ncbi:sulfotransferase family protein [Solilutibacter pythonis]|uniref:sulfotransferase family protein n=1 Tax=Solilutibacter pythonis TaxID=2483112 RepID=UPI0011C488F4|nr:hypothetical protein [Lysobacter pythonis]
MNGQCGQSQGVFLLGMHRSGTSALTRVLNLLGLHIGGKLLQAGIGNSSGHWEPIPVIEINERILAALGRTWSDPREMGRGWMQNSEVMALLPEAKMLLAHDFRPHSGWIIKDPRLSRLLPFWVEAAKCCGQIELSAVISLRHPWEVAVSLNRRDGMPLSQGFLLWFQHNREALIASEGMRRVIINYEDLLSDWGGQIERFNNYLELPLKLKNSLEIADSVESFLTSDARHENYEKSNADVPKVLVDFFMKMNVARDEEGIREALDYANSIWESASFYSEALTDIHIYCTRLQARVTELEGLALDSNGEVGKHLKNISDHLSRADWVNKELENKWRDSEDRLQCLSIREKEQEKQNNILQCKLDELVREKGILDDKVKGLCEKLKFYIDSNFLTGELTLQIERNNKQSYELQKILAQLADLSIQIN